MSSGHRTGTCRAVSVDRRRILAGTIVALAVITGCSTSSDDDPDTSVPTQADPLAAAVRVEALGCHDTATIGAGSFVANERVLTAAHVVAGATKVEVRLADGRRAEAKVTAIDRSLDLALLDVEQPIAPLALGSMAVGATGQYVVYRNDAPVALQFRVLARNPIEVPDLDLLGSSTRDGYEISATIELGDSGAVLVSRGVATAMVFARSAKDADRAWAVDIDEIRQLLQGDRDVAVDTGACVPG